MSGFRTRLMAVRGAGRSGWGNLGTYGKVLARGALRNVGDACCGFRSAGVSGLFWAYSPEETEASPEPISQSGMTAAPRPITTTDGHAVLTTALRRAVASLGLTSEARPF